MDPEKKSLNFIFPTKYVIPKSLKFSHWPSKFALKDKPFKALKGQPGDRLPDLLATNVQGRPKRLAVCLFQGG